MLLTIVKGRYDILAVELDCKNSKNESENLSVNRKETSDRIDRRAERV